MRRPLALAACLACAPVEPARPPAATPAGTPAPAPASDLPPELAEVVPAWQRVDRALADASPIWLLTRYVPGTYPCIEGPDGSLDMLQQDRFEVERVVRGAVQAGGLDLDLFSLRGPSYPPGFAEGRRYLLLLRPGPEAQAWLADPKHLGGMASRLDADDVLAAVDLDATRDEVVAEATSASREGERDGFRFTPAVWDALRRAPQLDPSRQTRLAAFLAAEVLRPGATLGEVRAWLGPPDDLNFGPGQRRRERYVLARPAYDAAAQDGLYGDLELSYGPDLRLRGERLEYLRWHVRPGQTSSIALTPAELARTGLPSLAR